MTYPWELLGYRLYDELWKPLKFNQEQIAIISTFLKDCNMILELGAGVGNLTQTLLESGKKVFSLDYDKNSIRYVKKKVGFLNRRKLYIKRWDINRLGQFIDGSKLHNFFDAACTASNMCYFDIERVVKATYDALSFKGYFAITGFESSKSDKILRDLEEETVHLITSAKIKFSPKEENKLKVYMEELKAGHIKTTGSDSLDRSLSALEREGFKILEAGSFYHSLAYYILAQKYWR